jgi:hypothetical protein
MHHIESSIYESTMCYSNIMRNSNKFDFNWELYIILI